MVDSIVVVGVLAHCVLLHSMCDLKATQINMLCGLIWELMLYKFKLGLNTAETTKYIYWAKNDSLVILSRVIRWFKILLGLPELQRSSNIRWVKNCEFWCHAPSPRGKCSEWPWKSIRHLKVQHGLLTSESSAAELYHILLKYWKTFDSP